jgi:hypothetical protein
MQVKVPNGFVDGLDYFNVFEIDELRGKQQNYLANKDLVVENIGHIPKILEDMILSVTTEQGLKWAGKISELIWKLPSGDIETLLIKIRENTYGAKFFHQGTCSHCGHENKNLKLDLSSLEIKYYPVEKLVEKKKLLLPKSNIEIELKPIYLKDFFEMIKINKNKSDSFITSLLALRIAKLGDNEKVTSNDIAKLSMKDIMFLEEFMEQDVFEGSIDTDIQIDCQKCNQEFTLKLNTFDPSFFVPSKESTT